MSGIACILPYCNNRIVCTYIYFMHTYSNIFVLCFKHAKQRYNAYAVLKDITRSNQGMT